MNKNKLIIATFLILSCFAGAVEKEQTLIFLDFERTVCGTNGNESSIDYKKGNYRLLNNDDNKFNILGNHIFEIYGRPYKYVDGDGLESPSTSPSDCFKGSVSSDEVDKLEELSNNSSTCYGNTFISDGVACKKTVDTHVRMKYYSIQKSVNELKEDLVMICDQAYLNEDGTIELEEIILGDGTVELDMNSLGIECMDALNMRDLDIAIFDNQ